MRMATGTEQNGTERDTGQSAARRHPKPPPVARAIGAEEMKKKEKLRRRVARAKCRECSVRACRTLSFTRRWSRVGMEWNGMHFTPDPLRLNDEAAGRTPSRRHATRYERREEKRRTQLRDVISECLLRREQQLRTRVSETLVNVLAGSSSAGCLYVFAVAQYIVLHCTVLFLLFASAAAAAVVAAAACVSEPESVAEECTSDDYDKDTLLNNV